MANLEEFDTKIAAIEAQEKVVLERCETSALGFVKSAAAPVGARLAEVARAAVDAQHAEIDAGIGAGNVIALRDELKVAVAQLPDDLEALLIPPNKFAWPHRDPPSNFDGGVPSDWYLFGPGADRAESQIAPLASAIDAFTSKRLTNLLSKHKFKTATQHNVQIRAYVAWSPEMRMVAKTYVDHLNELADVRQRLEQTKDKRGRAKVAGIWDS